MVNYQVEEFLLKIIDQIEFKNDILFFAVDKDTSYKSLLKEYVCISCENRLLLEKNRKMMDLLEQWIKNQGIPKKQHSFFKKLETIERNLEAKEAEAASGKHENLAAAS